MVLMSSLPAECSTNTADKAEVKEGSILIIQRYNYNRLMSRAIEVISREATTRSSAVPVIADRTAHGAPYE